MRLRVLVIEDDPLQADGLAHLLGSRGYYVEVARDGRQAIRRMCAETFQVALIDHRVPEIDGLSVARVIRNLRSRSERPRLVALTSAPQDLVADAAEFDEVLEKPFVLGLLVHAIEQARPAGDGVDGPVRAALALPVPLPPDASAGIRGRILLADDDEHLREFLRLTLQHQGFDIDVVADGLQAVKQLATRSYDVVVIDFNMPKLDGLAAAKVIYDLIERPTRPRIIALTSTPHSLVAQDPEWRLVLDEVVSKASGMPAILSAVEECINYKALRSEQPLEIVGLRSLTALARTVCLASGASAATLPDMACADDHVAT